MKTLLATTTAATLLALPVLAAAPADASGGDAVRRSGSCSGSTSWKIKAKADDTGIEVEAEVDSSRNGQTWRWRLLDNGDLVDSGRAQTKAPSGSFSVHRLAAETAGTDAFTFRATNRATGETCRAQVSL